MKQVIREIRKNVYRKFFKMDRLDYICGCVACVIAMVLIYVNCGA